MNAKQAGTAFHFTQMSQLDVVVIHSRFIFKCRVVTIQSPFTRALYYFSALTRVYSISALASFQLEIELQRNLFCEF